ncbi:MAG: hypothetical protein R3E79_45755 [Caldilineaceae bacterium]
MQWYSHFTLRRHLWRGRPLALLALLTLLTLSLALPAQAILIWQIETVDSAGDVGRENSLVLDSSGNPVISYQDQTNDDLKLVKCGNATCTSGNSIQTIDSAGGRFTSLALDSSGNPVISYFDQTNDDLKLVRCGTADCASGNSIQIVDSGGIVGLYTSLALDSSGNPVISYRDNTNGDLKLVHCGTADCASGNSIQTVDSAGNVGAFTSLVLDSSGNPVISYMNLDNGDLKLVHCGTADCASGNSIQTVDSDGFAGYYNSLALDSSGNPVISYLGGSGDLKLARCGTPDCAGGNSIQTVDSVGFVGEYTSLALDSSGNPIISYHDDTNADLKLVRCGTADCAGGNSFQTVDSAGDVGFFTALALDSSGAPVIAYFDNTNTDLKLARSEEDPPPGVTINQAAGQADPATNNPVLFTATFTEDVTGFTNSDVTLSGTADLSSAIVTISGGPSTYAITVAGVAGNGTVIATIGANVVSDGVGNGNLASTSTDNTVTFSADSSAPVITPTVAGTAGANGWYVSDVSVSWSVVDDESAISSQSGCETQTVTSDTDGVTFTCSASSAGGTASESVTIRRDATTPDVTVTGVSDGASYTVGSVPTAACSSTDALSGVATQATVTVSGGNPDGTGDFTATCSGATDVAGNSAALVSVSYTVSAPVDACTTTALRDDFNRANGGLGSKWAGLTGQSFYKIAGNQVDVQLGGPVVWRPTTFGVNQAAFVTLSTLDGASPSQGVLLKVQSGTIPNAGAISVVYDSRAKAVRLNLASQHPRLDNLRQHPRHLRQW